MNLEPGTSIYVHIPYCVRKCPYCDFASVPNPCPPENDYVDAVIREMGVRSHEIDGPVPTIYFGGGTPSLFSPDAIGRILSAIRSAFPVEPNAEVTLEINPSTVTEKSMAGYAAAGVNRASIGVQSLKDDTLRSLGRIHKAKAAQEAVRFAQKAGIQNINVDFLYGLSERTGAVLFWEIDRLLTFNPTHISAYCLTIHDKTPFASFVAEGRLDPAEDDESASEFDMVRKRLIQAGFEHYEISNFARPGLRSRHNERYWKRCPYMGLGAGATSFLSGTPGHPFGQRKTNVGEPEDYLRRIVAVGSAAEFEESPSFSEALGETLFLGLRRFEGIEIPAVEAMFQIDLRNHFQKEFAELEAAGLIEIDGDILRLTEKGYFVSDEVFCRFV